MCCAVWERKLFSWLPGTCITKTDRSVFFIFNSLLVIEYTDFLGQFNIYFGYVFGIKNFFSPQNVVCKFSKIEKKPQRFGLEAFDIRNLKKSLVRMVYNMFMKEFIPVHPLFSWTISEDSW